MNGYGTIHPNGVTSRKYGGVNAIHFTTTNKEYRSISNDESINFIGPMDEKNASLNEDLNMEYEDLPCANSMKRTYDKGHVVKVNENNICTHKEYIPDNNGVHVEIIQAIKDTTENANHCIYMLKKRETPRETLEIEESDQVLKIINLCQHGCQ